MKAKYCKCKNTYTNKDCDKECKSPYYWSQGIGTTLNQSNSIIRHSPRAFQDGFSKDFK